MQAARVEGEAAALLASCLMYCGSDEVVKHFPATVVELFEKSAVSQLGSQCFRDFWTKCEAMWVLVA